jgi:hypothetical protein
MLVEAGTAILVSNPDKAGGYYYFCIAYSLTYLVVLVAIIVLHIKENRSKLDIPIVKYVGKPMAYTAIMAVYVIFAFILRFDIVMKTINPGSEFYHSYTTFTTSLGIMFPGHDGQLLLSQTAVDLISDNLPTGIQPVDMRELLLTRGSNTDKDTPNKGTQGTVSFSAFDL